MHLGCYIVVCILHLGCHVVVICILVVQRRRSYENVDLTKSQTTGKSKLKNVVVDLYPRIFAYKEVGGFREWGRRSKATKSFSSKELLREWGFWKCVWRRSARHVGRCSCCKTNCPKVPLRRARVFGGSDHHQQN